jgi:hypothetical protein
MRLSEPGDCSTPLQPGFHDPDAHPLERQMSHSLPAFEQFAAGSALWEAMRRAGLVSAEQ